MLQMNCDYYDPVIKKKIFVTEKNAPEFMEKLYQEKELHTSLFISIGTGLKSSSSNYSAEVFEHLIRYIEVARCEHLTIVLKDSKCYESLAYFLKQRNQSTRILLMLDHLPSIAFDDIVQLDLITGLGILRDDMLPTPQFLSSLESTTQNLRFLHLEEPQELSLENILNSSIEHVQCLQIRFYNKQKFQLLDFLQDTNKFIADIKATSHNRGDFKVRADISLIQRLNDRKWPYLVREAIASGEKVQFRRSKLMFIGKGRAGKTSTINSLLKLNHNTAEPSTEVGCSLGDIGVYIDDAEETGVQWSTENKTGDVVIATKTLVGHMLDPRNSGNARIATYNTDVSKIQLDADVLEATMTARRKKKFVKTAQKAREIGKRGLSSFFTRFKKAKSQNLEDSNPEINRKIAVWDFGGQEVFYTVHHLFLTNNGIYALTFDLRLFIKSPDTEIANMKFWLNSITLYAPKTVIILVATHVQGISAANLEKVNVDLLELFQAYEDCDIIENANDLLAFFLIENSHKERKKQNAVQSLQNAIEKAMQMVERKTYLDLKRTVPLSWIYFMDLFTKRPSDSKLEQKQRIDVDIILARALEFNMPIAEVEEMLQRYNEFGVILSFREGNTDSILGKYIIMTPQWLIEALKTFLYDTGIRNRKRLALDSAKRKYELTGILPHSLLDRLLREKKFDEQERAYFYDLFSKTLLLSRYAFKPVPNTELCSYWFVPSMCQVRDAPIGFQSIESEECLLMTIRTLKPQPIGFFERIICLLVKRSNNLEGSSPPNIAPGKASVFFANLPVFISEKNETTIEARMQKLNSIKEKKVQKRLLEGLLELMLELREDKLGKVLQPKVVAHGEDDVQVYLEQLADEGAFDQERIKGLNNIFSPITKFEYFRQVFQPTVDAIIPQPTVQNFDCFIAHEWGTELDDYQSHRVAKQLHNDLRQNGFSVWFDEKMLKDTVAKEISEGIDKSFAIIVLLTSRYMQRANDNDTYASKEFNYASRTKKVKCFIPVVLEKELLDPATWHGTVAMHLPDKLYLDFSSKEAMTKNMPKLFSRIKEIRWEITQEKKNDQT